MKIQGESSVQRITNIITEFGNVKKIEMSIGIENEV